MLFIFVAPTWANAQMDKNAKTFTDGSQLIDPTPFLEGISVEDLRAHLTTLASDEYEGRETGQEGNRKAADYIANHFKTLGIPPLVSTGSYFQRMAFSSEMWTDIEMNINDKDFRHLWDFYAFPTTNSNQPSIESKEVLFIGYGIKDEKYNDYKGVNVKGKVLLAYMGEPSNRAGVSYLTGTKEKSEWTENWRKKLMTAYDAGAKAILFIDSDIKKNIAENRRLLLGPRLQLGDGEQPEDKYANNAFISTTIAKAIMGKSYRKIVKARKKIEKKGKPKNVTLKCDFKLVQTKQTDVISGDNVLGYIEGSDPNLKQELIVITAHYDHLGKRGDDIYNGADDNGSGTSTVLEVAQAFVEAKAAGKGPRRSVLCMLVTGEEKGLLGSKYYTEFPTFDIKNTVANVNVDMVGRVDDKYKDNPNYIYVIGSDRLSTELHDINEAANKNYTNLVLDYTYNEDDDPNRYYYRSDHYNFAEKGIPAIFYFNGTHADYHRTSDTVEKINFPKMAIIGKLVFTTAWELANRDKRIEVNVTGRN